MRVWTFQPPEVYEKLKKEKSLFENQDLISMIHDENGNLDIENKRAYDYMATQMKLRVKEANKKVEYPWWAWYKMDGKNQKPDLRKNEFRFSKDMICIELEIPEEKILLSDEEFWYAPLNNQPIILERDDPKWDEKYDWYHSLPKEIKQKEIEKTWSICFDLNIDIKDRELYSSGKWIQATFWELRLDEVISIRYVKKKLKP